MKNLPNELWKWDAVDLADGIRTRAISSHEAVAASIRRMEDVNPRLNAVVVNMADHALLAADAADAAVSRGDRLGALHGVPISIKINVDQVGQATSNGVVAFSRLIAKEDSPVVANFNHAGAITIGRTNTPAFSARWVTDNDLYGRTVNPWSEAHTPGGSSGGASVCVAAGITPIAHGNDLAGSVRYPAYCTGVAGLRPSFGRVPAYLPSAKSERAFSGQLMSVQGPLARRVADLRLALEVMAQADDRDPWWVPAPLRGEMPVGRIQVAMSVDPTGTGVDADVAAAVRAAASHLTDAGYLVEEIDPPEMARIAEDWGILSRAEAHDFVLPDVHKHGDDGIKKNIFWMLENAPRPDFRAYSLALSRRTSWIRQWAMFMRKYSLVLCPVSLAPPFLQVADVMGQAAFDEIKRTQAPSFALPVLGLPGVSVPTGVVKGLPMGVQIIGQRFREDRVLDAAQVIEARCPMQTPIDPQF